MTLPLSEEETEVGSYFVANYPPFSFWNEKELPALEEALDEPSSDVPLGLYLHIPFCRKRCKFCYFRVYTDKNSREVERYMAALVREIELLRSKPAIAERRLQFAYFGGGTPSFLSAKQLHSLVDRLREIIQWDDAEEVTFECEPGTLNENKLQAIRDIGVTRLSLGVENFSDAVLEDNGRAHHSAEIFRAYEWAREIGFDQVNIDLIAGMVGETDENWQDCVEQTLKLAPDCVTIYQMELPFNTVYSKEGASGQVATWKTKRRWVDEAFRQFQDNGYHVSSAYTVVKEPSTRFVYRDSLWRGADLLGTGVASFGHFAGVHYQNVDGFDRYATLVEEGKLPLGRALQTSEHQRLIREFVLQLKLGKLELAPFKEKYGVSVVEEFRAPLQALREKGFLEWDDKAITLSRGGLLRVDSFLEGFFESEHRGARYT